jgi:prepilin-type N-terminal cleavage/methylation domain-containing protein/prepilin-type processing-associated H-X9-DG protein
MVGKMRNAFTLVELLVVIAIIGMLMALLLPAVTQSINTARRTTCENNERQIAMGLLLYESEKTRFPGFVNMLSGRQTAAAPARWPMVTWVVAILPELQRRDLYDVFNVSPVVAEPQVAIDLLICPTDSQPNLGDRWLSYVVNCGQQSDRPSGGTPRADGIFFDRSNYITLSDSTKQPLDTNLGYIATNDGTSTTLMLSENFAAHMWFYQLPNKAVPAAAVLSDNEWEYETGFVWTAVAPGNAVRPVNRVNTMTLSIPNARAATYDDGRLSSGHPGGVVATFADGHTIFLSENIDNAIYSLMCTPNGALTNPSQAGMVLREADFSR